MSRAPTWGVPGTLTRAAVRKHQEQSLNSRLTPWSRATLSS